MVFFTPSVGFKNSLVFNNMFHIHLFHCAYSLILIYICNKGRQNRNKRLLLFIYISGKSHSTNKRIKTVNQSM